MTTGMTAKAQLSSMNEYGQGENKGASLSFQADYADGRNKAWAQATPSLSISMTVNGQVVDTGFFTPGGKYTVTFTKTED